MIYHTRDCPLKFIELLTATSQENCLDCHRRLLDAAIAKDHGGGTHFYKKIYEPEKIKHARNISQKPSKPHPPLEITGISGRQDWQVIKQACKHQPSKSLLRNLKEPRWIGIPNPNWAAAGIRNHGHGSIIRSGKHQPLGVEATQSVEDTPQQLLRRGKRSQNVYLGTRRWRWWGR